MPLLRAKDPQALFTTEARTSQIHCVAARPPRLRGGTLSARVSNRFFTGGRAADERGSGRVTSYAIADGAPDAMVTLCTNGSWTVGAASGTGLNLTAGVWQRVEVRRAHLHISAQVGGSLLANATIGPVRAASGNYTLRVELSHYFVASIDNFALDHAD